MRSLAYSLISTALGLGLLYWSTDGARAITSEGSRRVMVEETRPQVPDFRLQSMSGDFISLRPSSGETLVIEFIYTTCPTICISSGEAFARLEERLSKTKQNFRMISISFDPATDDPPALRSYAKIHGAKGIPWTVARADQAQLSALLDFFKVTVIPDSWGGYTHNVAILVIDKDGRFSRVFDPEAIESVANAVEGMG